MRNHGIDGCHGPQKKLLFLSGLTCLLLCSPVFAADPMVVFPQGDFSCTVDVTPHKSSDPDVTHPRRRNTPILKKITITQVGNIRRDTSVWSDKSISQLWSLTDKDVSVHESNDAGKEVFLLRGEMRENACPKLLHFDADSVSWITAKALDKQSASGKEPLHYQSTAVVQKESQTLDISGATIITPAVTAVYQAWIDPKTLLPLKFDDGDVLYTLKFSPDPPTGPLVIPANIQTALDSWLKKSASHPHL